MKSEINNNAYNELICDINKMLPMVLLFIVSFIVPLLNNLIASLIIIVVTIILKNIIPARFVSKNVRSRKINHIIDVALMLFVFVGAITTNNYTTVFLLPLLMYCGSSVINSGDVLSNTIMLYSPNPISIKDADNILKQCIDNCIKDNTGIKICAILYILLIVICTLLSMNAILLVLAYAPVFIVSCLSYNIANKYNMFK